MTVKDIVDDLLKKEKRGFILDEKAGEDSITEDGETEVSKLTDALMVKIP